MKRIDIQTEPTFGLLFKKEVARKVLLHYIDEVEAGYPPLLAYSVNDPKAFITEFLLHNPRTSVKKALQMLGLREFLQEYGIREFREVTGRHEKTNWYRLLSELKRCTYPQRDSPFASLRLAINEFNPLKLVDFQADMINNDKVS